MKSKYPYHLIEYDNFVSNPEKVLNDLYNFLGVDFYQHKFSNIDQFSSNNFSYDDSVVGKNLHTINSKLIERKGYDVSKYIPEDLINYYKTLNFWK